MGKAFTSELANLESTLSWANSCDVNPLEKFVEDVASLPIVAIGSGGSTTACHLTALLHRRRYQRPGQFMTPLDASAIPAGLHRAGVFLASASGKNKDILASLNTCITEEAPAVAVVTLSGTNPLTEMAGSYPRARVLALTSPSGKDGFLATNSLIATCALVVRAYGFTIPAKDSLNKPLEVKCFESRDMVQILHGGWGSPVATDLESKLNESALAAAQISDYRNFGHGRHLWLAKRSAETVVVALITPGTLAIAESTLKHFPKDVLVVRIETDLDGPAGTMDLLLQSFHLVERVGVSRKQDPGQPHVPEFGRKLYHLTPPRVRPPFDAPIQRKLWASPETGNDGKAFQQGLKQFLRFARTNHIGAVVLDYDGTLCTKDARFDGLREDVLAECTRLLSAGIFLGIATGRGKSVRAELQKALSLELWSLVYIGYYNGMVIGRLGDDMLPKTDGQSLHALITARALLLSDALLSETADITMRPQQLTVEPRASLGTDALAAHVMAVLAPLEGSGVRIVVSSHSLDVLGPQLGKTSLVSFLRDKFSQKLDVLCIGDRGAWPGNDYALLTEPMSLSVDEVSSLQNVCWNLAPFGTMGPDALLLYLRAIRACEGYGIFEWKEYSPR
ncbi:HAD hydrolase family protein [Synechococcus sp. CCAP 1479/9]|uniref:HAD hydrolase family protein n=1 Tax=Synechococcus sp. CCAP 1479/9 TaxID=1221593 RepID=UPI001C22515F|nr:HAD hydrolase family protein [Synechococcus sp. CCAP 1479/9]